MPEVVEAVNPGEASKRLPLLNEAIERLQAIKTAFEDRSRTTNTHT